jgi:hypothetical protein
MHATKLITPGVLAMLCIGLVLFMLAYRYIFRNKR